MENKILKVYDSITGEIVEIKVTLKIYKAYMRTHWNIHANNNSFYAHEIQFSELTGGKDNAHENFHEFVMQSDEDWIGYLELNDAISKLREKDRNLIIMLYYHGLTDEECAKLMGTTQQNINKKKRRILSKLNKLLKK